MEFVFDPNSERFVVGRVAPGQGGGLSPHQSLARAIGAGPDVVGGMLSRSASGEIVTNEFSGHYWQNWTPGVRKKFEEFIRDKVGVVHVHIPGM